MSSVPCTNGVKLVETGDDGRSRTGCTQGDDCCPCEMWKNTSDCRPTARKAQTALSCSYAYHRRRDRTEKPPDTLGVPASHYVLTTLDGWAVRVATSFPGLSPDIEHPGLGAPDYNALRLGIRELLRSGNLKEIIQASYSRLLVDEYQDCNAVQHEIVQVLAEILPSEVFGDPMHCIFSFSGPMPDWKREVKVNFPLLNTLQTLWRWINAGTLALGHWLLESREILLTGKRLQLDSCPTHVTYHQLTGIGARDMQMQQQEYYRVAGRSEGETILVLVDSRRTNIRHNFAQRMNGLDVVEPVDLKDVLRMVGALEATVGGNRVSALLGAAAEIMLNVEIAATEKRLATIGAGLNKTPPTPTESALLLLNGDLSRVTLLDALCAIREKPGVGGLSMSLKILLLSALIRLAEVCPTVLQ